MDLDAPSLTAVRTLAEHEITVSDSSGFDNGTNPFAWEQKGAS